MFREIQQHPSPEMARRDPRKKYKAAQGRLSVADLMAEKLKRKIVEKIIKKQL